MLFDLLFLIASLGTVSSLVLSVKLVATVLFLVKRTDFDLEVGLIECVLTYTLQLVRV